MDTEKLWLLLSKDFCRMTGVVLNQQNHKKRLRKFWETLNSKGCYKFSDIADRWDVYAKVEIAEVVNGLLICNNYFGPYDANVENDANVKNDRYVFFNIRTGEALVMSYSCRRLYV